MAACFVSAHSIMDTPHFSGDTVQSVHGARNRNALTGRSEVKSNRMDDQYTSGAIINGPTSKTHYRGSAIKFHR